MADDIDIEEHDVLESLRRRQQPDTSIVKSEPLEIDYEESNYEDSNHYENNYHWDWDKDKIEIKVEPHTAEEFRFGKIILGSKPADPQHDHETPGGSQDIREDDYNYDMSLVLDDWGPVLERSDCYCKTCQILFATVNALDAHKMIAHSFLVATEKQSSPERNRAIKSTAKPAIINDKNTCQICHFQFKGTVGKSNLMRHYKRIHRIDPVSLKNSDIKSWRVCNHCNLYFPDDTSLVKHLYELLPLNDKTPTKDEKRTVAPVKPKPVLNIDKNASKDVKIGVTSNVKHVNSPNKIDTSSGATAVPNRIILGSKPMAVNSKSTNNTDDSAKIQCEICLIQYNKKDYLLHMKKFHSDSISKKQPDKIILSDSNVRYKCQICHEILTSQYAMKKHRRKHPNAKGQRIIVKLVNKAKAKPNLIKKEQVKIKPNMIKKELLKMKSNVIQKESIKIKPNFIKKNPIKGNVKEVNEENKGVLVSKSTLFKCNRCSVHFLTCTGACQHSIVCESSSNIRDWACPQCQRVFKSAEKTAHEFQHKVLKANKFKVYVVYLEMIVRILCQCPNCFVCFEEDKFWRHVNGGCNDAASYFCNECKLPIDIHSKANHDSKHRQGDFTKDDFIKIDYVSSKPEVVTKRIEPEMIEDVDSIKVEADVPRKGLKRKLEMSADTPKKRRRDFDQLLLFHCQFCKVYLGNKSDFHLNGSCKKEKPRKFCQICGIHFKFKYFTTHETLHEEIPSLTISDYTFVRMADLKKIKPVQQMYPCKACNVNFLTKKAKLVHKCEDTLSDPCQVCQKMIPSDMFDNHMRIHKYVIPRQVKTITEMILTPSTSYNDRDSSITQNLSRKETQSPMTKLPDLLMKYQSLTALWNILYLCAICDTFTDSYDKVVEHCQNHLTNMEYYGVVIMKCEKCGMKFDSECFKRHLELHAENKVISKKTFQILKYEHYDLFTDKWFDFIDLPEEQKSQIVRRSIYGENRCVKMKLVQQGPPEYTLYKCEKCLNCVVADTIVYHVKLANCCKAHKIPCSVCEMTFAIRRDCEEHERIHETTGLGLQSFRIISFNDANDAEANNTIMSYDTENHGSKSKITFTDDETAPKTPKLPKFSQNNATLKTIVFYKCAECLTCVLHIRNFAKHSCNDIAKQQCKECGLYVKRLRNHEFLHKKYKFTRNNVIIKTLNKDGKVINIKKQTPEKKSVADNMQNKLNQNTDQKPKLYKCFCGLHYTSLKTIEKHYKLKNCSTVIREKCSQCNLVFDPIEVVNHLCKHHAQNQVKTFNIITPNKKTLYKCGVCHVLFYNKAAAIPHKAKCTGKFCGKKCEKCGLAFDGSSLATHMVDHERNNKLRNDCYVIVKIPDEKLTVTDKALIPSILYKCKVCDIHFLRRTSARNHIMKSSQCGTTLAETCKICKRRFPTLSILKHVAWQHNKLKIKEFIVRELIPGVNTKLSKHERTEDTGKAKVKKEVEEVVPKKEPVKVTVYRCVKCMLLFTDESSLFAHLEDRCSKELTEECEECDVKFAFKNIRDHNRQHGPGIALSMTIVEDVQVPEKPEGVITERKLNRTPYVSPANTLDGYDNKLYKCTLCNFHYLNRNTLVKHECKSTDGLKCDICDITFARISLIRHKRIHEKYNFKKEDFVILTLNDGVPVPESPDYVRTERKPKKDLLDRYDNKLYKCTFCGLHFLTPRTQEKHVCNPKNGLKCEVCDIPFTWLSLRRHKLIHEKYNFKKEDFVILSFNDDAPEHESPDAVRTERKVIPISYKPKKPKNLLHKYDNKLYKCTVCGLHFLTQSTQEKHDCNPDKGLKCEICDIPFTWHSLRRHKLIHEKYNFKKEDFVILTWSDLMSRNNKSEAKIEQEIEEDTSTLESNSSLEVEAKENSPEKPKIEESKKDTQAKIAHFLFKCAACNIYFNTRITCHKHISNHALLDPKEYIECKFCGFQFTIMGLPPHIKKNHANTFNLEDVLVEEYQPNDTKTHETYYASEKDQSALVSTSEDVKNDSNVRDDNDCEVSSCNELAEKVDSSDNSTPDKIDVTSDKIKVKGQTSNEITEPNVSEGNVMIDSSDNNDTMMNFDVNDEITTNDQDSNDLKEMTKSDSIEGAVIIDSTDDNSIQVNKLIADSETKINDLKEITEPYSSDGNITVESSHKNDDDKTISDEVNDDSKEIAEPIS